MANVKITDLTALTSPETTDVLPIVDVDTDVTKKVSVGEVVGKISGDVNVSTNGTSSIASGAIVNADINASAAIADTKLATISTAGKVSNSATTATDANTANAIVARDASGDFSAGTITADLTGNADTATALETARNIGGVSFDGTANINLPGVNTTGNQDTSGNAATATKLDSSRTFAVTGDVTGTVSSDLTSGASISTSIASGVIVNADVNAAAAIAGTKIDPDFGSQTVETTGVINAGAGTEAAPSVSVGTTDNGLYSPGTDQVAISTNGTGRLFITSDGKIGFGTASPDESLGVVGNIKLSQTSTQLIFEDSDSANLTINRFFSYDGALIADVDPSNNGSAGSTFRINVDGSERARIDSFGRLGLGTSSPIYAFDCRGQGAFELYNTSGGGNVLNFRPSLGDASKYNMSISSYDHQGEGTAFADGLSINAYDGVSICTGNNTARQERFLVTRTGAVICRGAFLFESQIAPASADADGSADAPSICPGYDYDTGLFHPGSNEIGFSTAGSERLRIDGSGRLLIGTSSRSGNSLLQVNDDRIRIASSKTPASASDTGTAGEICWDSSYIYVCTATDTWKRAALSTW